MLDEQAGLNTRPLAQAYAHWREAMEGLARAKTRQGELDSERERLAWQIGELERLGPKADEWAELNAEHQRLGHGRCSARGSAGGGCPPSTDDHRYRPRRASRRHGAARPFRYSFVHA